MRGPAPRSIAIRDQLLATLRNSADFISTPDLVAEAGLPFSQVDWWMPCTRACVGDYIDPWGYMILACARTATDNATEPVRHVVAMPPSTGVIYPHLRALERLGLVARVYKPDNRLVFWAYVHNESDAEMNALLDSLEGTN